MPDVGDELGIKFGAQRVGILKEIYSQMIIMEAKSCSRQGCSISWMRIKVGICFSKRYSQTAKIFRLSWKTLGRRLHEAIEGCPLLLSWLQESCPRLLRFEFHKKYNRASRLIKPLVAEGFLKRENRCKSFEEEVEKCLEDLVRRSLVLVTRKFR
ncbi:hypothetical protein ACS0TY_023733 [Phlomoides rotata]